MNAFPEPDYALLKRYWGLTDEELAPLVNAKDPDALFECGDREIWHNRANFFGTPHRKRSLTPKLLNHGL
jgi:hypothetical protein